MKDVFLEPAWKLRGNVPSVQSLFLYPPEGYAFVTSKNVQNNIWNALSKYQFSFNIQTALNQIIPLQLVKGSLETFQPAKKNICLTYSLNHCILRNEPWLLDMLFELPFILCGSEGQLDLFKGKIIKNLTSPNCKKIIFQVKMGMDAFRGVFGDVCDDKIEIIPCALAPKFFDKRSNDDKVRILFVNSANINTDMSFYYKGGAEVVDSFLKIRKIHQNVELILRTAIPEEYRKKVANIKEIKILDTPLPKSIFEEMWESADIFIHPHHTTPTYSLFDAMSYGLPILTTDTYANPEIVENGKNGFLIHDPLAANYFDGKVFHITDPNFRKKLKKGSQPQIVDDLVDRLSLLIDNSTLRARIGAVAKLEVLNGKYSIIKRNQSLKKIFNEIT